MMSTLSIKFRHLGNFNRHAGSDSVSASPENSSQGTYLMSSPRFENANFRIPTYAQRLFLLIQNPATSANRLFPYKL